MKHIIILLIFFVGDILTIGTRYLPPSNLFDGGYFQPINQQMIGLFPPRMQRHHLHPSRVFNNLLQKYHGFLPSFGPPIQPPRYDYSPPDYSPPDNSIYSFYDAPTSEYPSITTGEPETTSSTTTSTTSTTSSSTEPTTSSSTEPTTSTTTLPTTSSTTTETSTTSTTTTTTTTTTESPTTNPSSG